MIIKFSIDAKKDELEVFINDAVNKYPDIKWSIEGDQQKSDPFNRDKQSDISLGDAILIAVIATITREVTAELIQYVKAKFSERLKNTDIDENK